MEIEQTPETPKPSAAKRVAAKVRQYRTPLIVSAVVVAAAVVINKARTVPVLEVLDAPVD